MITLTLDEKELQAMVGLMDVGLKAVGLQGAEAASHLMRRISEAKQAADTAAAPSNVVPMQAAE
jgi:hypothetical protein